MSLNDDDKAVISGFWGKASSRAAEIGADALGRMLVVYPQTKTYFDHWKDKSPSSHNVRKHGKKIMDAIGDAITLMGDLNNALLELSQLHAFTLRVDPSNFKMLSHNILVVMANYFPDDFTPDVHLAMDKFLAAVARALSERYR
ncbi:hemoglobin subunit alpha-1-like [Cynoglossus semilaevis]|uniref:hemoglobin subunit alpha-1-like n=1 Tax=Cynoglossus semilaevis TaxID=244447 RepID=UPI000495693D|nr:hemoglobin subunit alpha-1-like [Cynoglossus semilaevis]